MGTQAYWMFSPWRYRIEGDFGWTFAETLADVKTDMADVVGIIKVQKRTGRKAEGYVYVDHSTIEQHANYPHEPGRLHDCAACEARCHCGPEVARGEATECIWSGHEAETTTPEMSGA